MKRYSYLLIKATPWVTGNHKHEIRTSIRVERDKIIGGSLDIFGQM